MATFEPALTGGRAFTETVTFAVFWQPFEPIPVTVYVVVADGFAVGPAHVVQDNAVAGDHV